MKSRFVSPKIQPVLEKKQRSHNVQIVHIDLNIFFFLKRSEIFRIDCLFNTYTLARAWRVREGSVSLKY